MEIIAVLFVVLDRAVWKASAGGCGRPAKMAL